MKPAVQVPLAIALVAVLVYIMYWRSQMSGDDNTTRENQEQVVTKTGGDESPEAGSDEESATGEEGLELDALVDDEPEEVQLEKVQQPAQTLQTPKKKAAGEQAKRASASLRERRRNMFKKIDVSQKDGRVSKDEHDVFFRNAFQFYDKNKDGRLTGYEINQVRRLPRHADENKDRVLTRKEFLDQFERFFAIMDVDKSGDLTEQEFVR